MLAYFSNRVAATALLLHGIAIHFHSQKLVQKHTSGCLISRDEATDSAKHAST